MTNSEVDPVQRAPDEATSLETLENGVPTVPSKSSKEETPLILDKIAQQQRKGPAEDPAVLDSKVRGSYYSAFIRNTMESERESGSLESRSQQAILHLTFTDLRLRDVENELLTLKMQLNDLPAERPRGKRRHKEPVYRHVLQRSTFNTFRLTVRSFNVPVSERPALEVLVDAPAIPVQYPGSSMPLQSRTGPDGSQGKSTLPQPVPERLRIRSKALIDHLERITREKFPAEAGMNSSGYDTRQAISSGVIIRPYKLLVVHEKKIKESLRDIEANMKEEAERVAEHERQGLPYRDEKSFDYRDLYEDLKLLIEFLDVDLRPVFDLRERIRNRTITHIEFEDLWHLFSRGDFVIAHSSREHAYRVINFTGGRDLLSANFEVTDSRFVKSELDNLPTDGFTIDCWSLRNDGSNYVPLLKRFSIRKFLGAQPIASLPVYPWRLDPNAEEVREALIAQGTRFLELTKPRFVHKNLTGKTLDEPSHEINAQVIVDMTLAINSNPEWRLKERITEDQFTRSDRRETREAAMCNHRDTNEGCCGSDVIFKDLDVDQQILSSYVRENSRLMGPRKAQDLEEDELMLLPGWVYGFVLRTRQWVTMRTSDLSEVKFENDFNELILPEEHKKTVQALVETHESARSRSSGLTSAGIALDLVRGKGTGLIILLHGEPGVGKTSTAECVADNTKRPLYPITCGDIGETATEVETNLYRNFQLAHKWGCVLLLDEADVFLAKRNKTDLRRNAVTSVFLRSLEYYAGILFLTTNRVGGIDPAFKSRIHMSLYYERLSLKASLKLYEVFIRRTRAEQERSGSQLFRIKDRQIMHFAEKHYRQLEKEGLGTWNGRQIRNAFQTAIALTEHDSQHAESGQPKPILGKAQFQIVANGSREFDRYLMSTLGAAEADIAMREEWRADRYAATNAATMAAAKSFLYGTPRTSAPAPKDTESEGATESSEDEDDETSDDDDGNTVPGLPTKSKKSEKNQSTSTRKTADLEEYEEFLKWKRNRSR